jgi:hypothetical protein
MYHRDDKAIIIQKAWHDHKKFEKMKANALKNIKILNEIKIKNREQKRLKREKIQNSVVNRILNSTEGWIKPIIHATAAVSEVLNVCIYVRICEYLYI